MSTLYCVTMNQYILSKKKYAKLNSNISANTYDSHILCLHKSYQVNGCSILSRSAKLKHSCNFVGLTGSVGNE